jgi:dipeptidyl aminopeptidase/acylaminoacyl peptidase
MRTRRIPLAVIALVMLAPLKAAAGPGGFTLEQILEPPFPTDLVAAPAEGRVAWVFNAAGVRNVWVAEPPDYRGRQLTAYNEDDGLEISDLEWSPDARTLLYVRGGEEGGGEYPNPRSQPTVPKQEVWAVAIDKGAPRCIGEGESPKVSPRDNRVVFLRKGQIWWAPLDGSDKPEQLLQTRGNCESLRWSPDGAKLAFVSDRKDHSLIGVYDWAAKAVRWLDPSVDLDGSPVWSPDGRQVAFVRVPSARALLVEDFTARREGEPWSIRVADATTGEGRQVWKADRGVGSVFREVVGDDQLWWADGDRLVFPWEKDGWTHLYAVRLADAAPTPLTPGPFEVEWVSISPDRRRLVFASNQDDIDRRHLWTVPVAGGPPTQLTKGKGIEWAPATTSDGKAIAFLHSDARRPAQPAVVGAWSGDRAPTPEAKDLAPGSVKDTFPEKALVEPQAVEVAAADGMTIHCQLFLPADMKSGERRPAVVFFHGGSRRQMLLGWHYMSYYHRAYALNQYLASKGYVVLSVNYRSGIGYGMEFREALHYGAAGASEFNDVQGAGLYLRDRADVDPKRIGLWGGSYGGYLTALGLARAPDLFAAGVDIHGVYDWNAVIHNFRPDYDPQAQRDAARLAFESSPAASVKSWRAPVLVIHGDDDRNVPFSESVHLIEDLRKQKVEVEQLVFPDEVHVFLTHRRVLQAFQAAADFFDRRLRADLP